MNRRLDGLQSRSERFGDEEKCLAPHGIQTPDHSARSLASIPSTLCRLSIWDSYCGVSRPQLSNEGYQLLSCSQRNTGAAPISLCHTTHNIQSPTRAICCYSVNLKEKSKTSSQQTRNSSTESGNTGTPVCLSFPTSKRQREIPSLPSERLGVHTLHNKATMQSIVICLPISSSFSYFCVSPLPPFLCHSFTPVFHSPTYASPIPSPVLLILMTYLLSFLPSTALFSYLSACDFNPPSQQSNYPPDADSILATKHATTSNVRTKDAFMQRHLYFALLDVFLATSHSLNIDSYSTDRDRGNFCNP